MMPSPNVTQMARHSSQSPPFSVRLLDVDADGNASVDGDADQDLLSLLPASHRTAGDDLAIPSLDVESMEAELNLERLSHVHRWLWFAGRPMPPRPLHYQLLLRRDIFVTERMDQHLIWFENRIFLKPIPRFLLEPPFWTAVLACRDGCLCYKKGLDGSTQREGQMCERRRLWKAALGLIFSYTALLTHESDFFLAKEKGLLPRQAKWLAWKNLVTQILSDQGIYQKIHQRFIYGELRLSRLNMIYRLARWQFVRGYMPKWYHYGGFFHDNFAWLAIVITYIAIVLTAMQVGLATENLAQNDSFQSASYGFTVFSILGPLAAIAIIFLIFACIFVQNWIMTSKYWKRRLQAIQARSESS